LPVAARSGGKVEFFADLDSADRWEAGKQLVRSSAGGLIAELA
jgi:hypothetical protein